MTQETDAPQGGAEGEEPTAVETPSEATTDQTTGTDDTGQADDAGDEPAPKKVPWFQKRIDEVTASKYEAQREAAYWKGIAEGGKAPTQAPELSTANLPKLEDFDWDEAKYQVALTKHITDQAERSIDEKLSLRERELTETQKNDKAIANLREGGAKHPDFIAAVSGVKASEAVRDFLLDDNNAATILYELGKDTAAAERFNNLSPVQQAIELGKRSATPKSTRTIPPPPPETVSGIVSGIGKTPEEMSMAEYAAWVKERDKT